MERWLKRPNLQTSPLVAGLVRAHDVSTELLALPAWGHCVPTFCVMPILDFSWPPSVVKDLLKGEETLKKEVSCVPLDCELAGGG